MPRSRELKYGFFVDEDVAELSPLARLLFQGLWCLADRDGRLEDRPARIKVQVLPFDNADVNALLDEIANCNGRFIARYEVCGRRYIQIRSLSKNQHFHPKEASAGYPPPPSAGEIPGKPENFPARQSLFLTSPALPSLPSLPSEISDPPIVPQGGTAKRKPRAQNEYSEAFAKAWKLYVRGEDKAGAYREWKKQAADLPSGEAELLEKVSSALAWQTPVWRKSDSDFPKHQVWFTRYLSHRRWEDEKPYQRPVLLEQRPPPRVQYEPKGDYAAEAAADRGEQNDNHDAEAAEAVAKLTADLAERMSSG